MATIRCHLFLQVDRLDSIVKDKEQGLGSMSSNVTSLQEAADRLKQELDATRVELRTAKNKASSLQVCHFMLSCIYIELYFKYKYWKDIPHIVHDIFFVYSSSYLIEH